jgi:type I restriction enzyme S subunit
MRADCFPQAPPEWGRFPIGVLAEINPRYAINKASEYSFVEMAAVGNGFRGIQRFDTRRGGSSGLSRFRAGDTLFAKITPCPQNGKIAFCSEVPSDIGLGSTEFIVLSPRSTCNPRFLYHLMTTHEVRGRAAARMEGSTGRQRVPESAFRQELLVPLPPRPEQDRIAGLLDEVDQTLESLRTRERSAISLRASLVDALLTRGATGNDAATTVLNGALRTPAHWDIRTVRSEFELQTGFTLNPGRLPRVHKYGFLRVANVKRDRLDLQDVDELEASAAEVLPRTLQDGDLVLVEGHANSRQVGRCALITSGAAGLTFQNHLFRLRSRGEVLPEFGVLWLNSQYAQRYWEARCGTSSGLHTINQRALMRMAFPVPDKAEQLKIVENAQAGAVHIAAVRQEAAEVESLKRSLMSALFSGDQAKDYREEFCGD